MSNFGFARLRVVNPYEVAFREARSAVGAAEILTAAEEYKTVADAIADCSLVVGTTAIRNRQPRQALRSLNAGASLIRAHLKSGQVALLFGSEKRGLSNDDLSHCHWLMRIPTLEEHPSMNLGQSVAVCLYEFVRAERIEAGSEARALSNAAELERITGLLLETLRASGYLNDVTAQVQETKIRTFVLRLGLRPEDSELLLGMLRQIAWKLKNS